MLIHNRLRHLIRVYKNFSQFQSSIELVQIADLEILLREGEKCIDSLMSVNYSKVFYFNEEN